MPRLEYFFDYVSPFAYLADTQLPALRDRTGAEIVYRPFFLGGVMQASKNAPPISVPNKGRYMFTEIQRWARRYGVPANPNPHFPVNTLGAMRAAVAALDVPGFADFHRAMFRAVWVDGRNLADEAVLRAAIEDAGLDAARLLERARDPAVKALLKRNGDEAVERGAFGAPTFFVGDEMFWGNDRLDFVEEALRA
ncbi:2-hydroxychromene-2-carboxylate isomerase [bacterium]|nr:2-hydroxychromene-2-carboxylate isomerase [bacterium]